MFISTPKAEKETDENDIRRFSLTEFFLRKQYTLSQEELFYTTYLEGNLLKQSTVWFKIVNFYVSCSREPLFTAAAKKTAATGF